jgi:glycosyltransferase involved in cell wall biosynthesis
MRIAIVDPYFAVGLGYQTTGWYNAFVAQGHQVRAFCSCVPAFSSARHLCQERFSPGLTHERGGEVLRLGSVILPRDMAICKGLRDQVIEFQPHITLVVYPGTLFARELVHGREQIPGVMFTTFGENTAQRRAAVPSLRFTLKRAAIDVAFYLLKRRYYRRAIEVSDLALMHTPDTIDFLLPRIAAGRALGRLKSKCVLWPLGFDALELRADAAVRAAERARLGLSPDNIVIMYSGRIEAVKRFDVWVSMVASAMRRLPKLRAMLIGFRKGETESEKLLGYISATGMQDRFLGLPFAGREELFRLYNAADIGLWHLQPSVGIQECMGTGMYMTLADSRTMSHLLIEPVTGRYFADQNFEQAADVVAKVAEEFSNGSESASWQAREHRALLTAQHISYQAMAARLIRAAQEPAKAREHLCFDGIRQLPDTAD